MIDFKQVYQQSNCHKATFQILQMKAQLKVFQYGELNANAVKQCHNNEMSLTKASIKQIMKNL